MKKKIIIWGGNNKPLTIANLNSHASVTAFFLTKYLSTYYEIVNVVDMNSPEEIMKHDDVYAVLSTFQRGFTNRLILKNQQGLFQEIRKHVKGPLCSVYDYNYDDVSYCEDVIFTVREPNAKNTARIKKKSLNPGIRIRRMGWCADPEFCYPEFIDKDRAVNIFIDHPSYSANAVDYTKKYHEAFSVVKQRCPDLPLRVYQQDNHGIVEMNLLQPDTLNYAVYNRTKKVPWQEIIGYYRKMHIFCITTPQSACLSAAEAAMCGAKLYVPKYRLNRYFIPNDLLCGELSFRTFRGRSPIIASVLLKDIKRGFSREANNRKLLPDYSWKSAAEIIYQELSKK